MSLNTAHINGGVLIHAGECILLFSENVTIEFTGPQENAFKGKKEGRIYLTTHRMIFNSKSPRDEMQSFSFPFVTLSDVELEQPVFGANYIKGKVRAQPNGNWIGEAKFKLIFKHGGAIDFGQAMLRAAHFANNQGFSMDDAPPPYQPPQGNPHPVPPPAYAPPPQGYYGWVPPYQVFPEHPPVNSVYVHDVPPPYPGIVPGYQGNGYPQQQGGGYSFQQVPGYPTQPGGYPPAQEAAGSGFRSAGDAKSAEAAQSAYYDPNRPQMAYVPPPYYYEHPPSYDQATNKKDQ